jgi:hypothetical protein
VIEKIESRWPVALAIIAFLWLLLSLPARLSLFPTWVTYAVAIAMLAPLFVVGLARDKRRWMRIERVVLLVFAVLGLVVNVVALSRLVHAMLTSPSNIPPLTLLTSSVADWVANIILFALLYWLLDRGGPEGRSSGSNEPEDFTFTQGSVPREPVFVDYLALAFNTSTAFSPTDTLPVTPRGKLLMMAQSAISLVTVVVVGARAINILK